MCHKLLQLQLWKQGIVWLEVGEIRKAGCFMKMLSQYEFLADGWIKYEVRTAMYCSFQPGICVIAKYTKNKLVLMGFASVVKDPTNFKLNS